MLRHLDLIYLGIKLYIYFIMPNTKVIKSVGPVSAGKVLGMFYLILGGLVGLVFGSVMTISSLLTEGALAKGVLSLIGIGMVVLFALLYGAMGFICAWIAAHLYNLAAGWIGGIEIGLK